MKGERGKAKGERERPPAKIQMVMLLQQCRNLGFTFTTLAAGYA